MHSGGLSRGEGLTLRLMRLPCLVLLQVAKLFCLQVQEFLKVQYAEHTGNIGIFVIHKALGIVDPIKSAETIKQFEHKIVFVLLLPCVFFFFTFQLFLLSGQFLELLYACTFVFPAVGMGHHFSQHCNIQGIQDILN